MNAIGATPPPPPPPPKPKGRAALGCLFTLGAAVVFFIMIGHFASSGIGNSTSSTESTNAEIAINVTALQLWSDYQANEVAADAEYKDKALAVHGVLASIDKDFTDSVVLQLRTPNEFMPVHAALKDSETQKAAALSKGGKTTLLCRGGGMVIGSPVLSDCTIQ